MFSTFPLLCPDSVSIIIIIILLSTIYILRTKKTQIQNKYYLKYVLFKTFLMALLQY